MYLCCLCKNKTLFKEENVVETEVTLDEAGAVAATSDTFVVCEAVICGSCGASSEEGHILDPKTLKPIGGPI